ncbi:MULTISPECIES: AraC family transcriptional regulator [unclassified Curtobacterium]|uniref:AraC family transcriptional regulator n=1 Tax=unclassified Curtobacterium TaxID=257496 RepID=UPI000DA8CA1C|nr:MULTISPECIES: AraC family transcriptional regulator [unclassified Curtobacterium]PZF36068.1 AraC family transcriptional regulator [Curtobacterium sp. MCLR17_053]PZF45801.1 AraC family transcriptional regulator [Curtobacterium sp. MCLR17_051]
MDDVTSDRLDRALQSVLAHLDDAERAGRLGLRLARVDRPTDLGYQRYTPSVSVVLAGQKRSIVGDDDQLWGRERFIITPVDLPVIAGVVEVEPPAGFVAVVWQLDPAVVAEVATAMSRPHQDEAPPARLGSWTPALADAFARLVGLLDAPEDMTVLAPLVTREVVLRLLQTDQAPRILAAIGNRDGDVVAAATALLTDRLADPWSVAGLAAAVRTSESTLFARFRQVTGMSPVQYLRRLRLGEARRRMIVLGDTAAQAAVAVGYRSASHFSRDYRALHGRPPAADAGRARELLALGEVAIA